ncbi:MAG: peptidylprolyl isomerase [Actinomycetota bacterium]|nr:peptidylprolyl isomerase [Actinomycetota bacterium]
MRQFRLILSLPVVALALVAAACGGGGGGGSVPSDAVAVVGDQTITKADFDRLIGQAERSYKQQGRTFPKPGTQEYEQLKQQAVQFLVQRSEFEQKADDLGISVSDKQVDQRLAQIKKQYFGQNEARFRKQLKAQGLTEAQVRADLKSQLLSEAIFKKVTSDAKVTDEEVEKYYKEHRSQYETPESRDVRHILISCNTPAACTKAKATASKLYDQLKDGANFAALAKKYSDDPGSKAQGGKLTVARGQTVAPFDQTAFLLAKGQISRPLKTQYGYHIIQPLSNVKPKKVTPFSQVKESIRQQLLQQKRNEEMNTWVEETKKDFDVSYQVGFAPQKTPQSQR